MESPSPGLPHVLSEKSLRELLELYRIDSEKFRKPLAVLLAEYNSSDTVFFITSNSRLAKKRYSAKVHIAYKEYQWYEMARVFPNGETVRNKKIWTISGTLRQAVEPVKNNLNGETPVAGAIREIEDELGFRVTPDQLLPLNGGLPVQAALRESEVWLGIQALELQYHFLLELSSPRRLLPRPEPDGTRLIIRRGPRVTYSYSTTDMSRARA